MKGESNSPQLPNPMFFEEALETARNDVANTSKEVAKLRQSLSFGARQWSSPAALEIRPAPSWQQRLEQESQ